MTIALSLILLAIAARSEFADAPITAPWVEIRPKNQPADTSTNIHLRLRGDRIEAGRVEVRLSGIVQLELIVEGSELRSESVRWVADSLDWHVQEITPPQRVDAGKSPTSSRAFLLEPLRPGEILLPLASLRIGGTEMQWPSVTVQVTTEARPDSAELRDIAPLERLPLPPSPWRWFVAALVLLIVVVCALVTREVQRRYAGPLPALSPEEQALAELEEIEKLPVASCQLADADGEAAQFYIRVSDVVRRYCEHRWGLPAPQQTTPEFLAGVERSPLLPPQHREILRDLLQGADLAKFARVDPSVEEYRQSLTLARTFVRETAQKPSKTA